MALDADLDHIAFAAEHAADQWARYAANLGGTYVGEGASPGFSFQQFRFANGMAVELLEPANVDDNDFLRRFLDHTGPGPHHVTFKVADLVAALDEVRAAGFSPVGVYLDDPGWKEAFLHPKEAFGIVVQLAQPSGSWVDMPPIPGLPAAERPPATLVRLTHLVADLVPATALFAGLLGGRVEQRDERHVDLAWTGPGRIRLVQPEPGSADAAWLGARPGRLRDVEFAVDDPGGIPGSRPAAGGYEIDPDENLGVRLVLT